MSKKISFELFQFVVLVVAFIASVGYAAHWKWVDSSTPTPRVVRPVFTEAQASVVLCGEEGEGDLAHMKCEMGIKFAAGDIRLRYLAPQMKRYTLYEIERSLQWMEAHARR